MLVGGVARCHADDRAVAFGKSDALIRQVVSGFCVRLGDDPLRSAAQHRSKGTLGGDIEVAREYPTLVEARFGRAKGDRCGVHASSLSTFSPCCCRHRSMNGSQPRTARRSGATGRVISSSTSTRCRRSGSTSPSATLPACSTRRRSTSIGSPEPTPSVSWRGLTRDIRSCEPGQAQYTIWCDDRGFVNEDGVVLRYGPDDFLLTTAEPNLAYLLDLRSRYDVEIDDVSRTYAMLAVQGPRSAVILGSLAPEIAGSGSSATRLRNQRGRRNDLADRLHRRPRLRGDRGGR